MIIVAATHFVLVDESFWIRFFWIFAMTTADHPAAQKQRCAWALHGPEKGNAKDSHLQRCLRFASFLEQGVGLITLFGVDKDRA
jgi:hypothetical protein